MKNIYAFTETGANYPGYISINRETDGRHTIAARTRGTGIPAVIEMQRHELEAMARGILSYLGTDAAPAKPTGKARK